MENQLFTDPSAVRATGFDGCYLARVVSLDDPERLARVQVMLLSFADQQDHAEIWARVAVPCAGANRGTFLLPDVNDEVLVSFINGDARLPVVVGGLWNGGAEPPEQVGAGGHLDRWTLVGREGTRIAIVEERNGQPTISLSTPGGVRFEITDAGGGRIECRGAGVTITVDSGGVSIQSPSLVKVQASQVEVSAGMVRVDAGMSRFSGVVQCDTLITNTVVASSYTPGAGNIW
jgi:uncharacterized protein involved in type VI secretion and phage assembly